jgi:hypothetical protein
MTFKEAAIRIAEHTNIHQSKEPNAVKITEALEIAVGLLLWADKQPAMLFEDDVAEIINEYYNNGLRDGFRRAKRVYGISDGNVYYTDDKDKLTEFKADSNRIARAIKDTKKYEKRIKHGYNY